MSEKYELELYVAIRQVGGGGYLEIREKEHIDATGFLEIAGVLSKFHELAEKMKSVKEGT